MYTLLGNVLDLFYRRISYRALNKLAIAISLGLKTHTYTPQKVIIMESIIDNTQSGKDIENLDNVKDARILVVGAGGAGNNQVTRIQKKKC